MLKILIVDDEPKARKVITAILEKHFNNNVNISTADSVKSAVETINNSKPDLILLDVQLGDGTGFDVLSKLEQTNFKIIFVTAYEQFAIKAFKFSAFDYILKPINPNELIQAIQRADEVINKENIDIKLNILLSSRQKEAKKIVLKTADSLHVVNIQDIVRCEADGNYTCIYFNDKKKLLVSKTLREFDELFTEYEFFRVHNAHLINITYIERCEKTKGGNVFMKDESVVPIAFARKQALLELLEKF